MDLGRNVLIHICADGTVTFRRRLDPLFNIGALPVASVDTVEEAQALLVLLCRVQPTDHHQLPGQPWYRYVPFSGDMDGLPAVEKAFAKAYNDLRAIRNNISKRFKGAA
jgi:hypothetical protein